MKACKSIIIIFLCCFVLNSCTLFQSKYFGFKTDDFRIIDEKDTHGGFHGDGTYYLILDCSGNKEKARDITKEWKPLPLSENLSLIMYGGEKGNKIYGFNLAEEAHFPVINNGVYKFVDRHSESKNRSDDSDLFDRYSFNFSIAIYDLDNDMLYYFEFDT